MKATKLLLVLSCILLALTGCNQEEGNNEIDNNLMSFDILYPSATRATTTGFEKTDKIGLFITEQNAPLQVSGNYVNNALLTYSGTAWTPHKPVYWNDGKYNVFAYYPYVSPVTSVDDFPISVALDQSTSREGEQLGGYEASDFLWANAGNVTSNGSSVKLAFKHTMSKVIVRLIKGEDFDGELPTDAQVYIHNTVTDATIDLSIGIVTKHPYGTERTIKAMPTGNYRYTGIVVPQRLVNRRPLIEVVMQGVSYLMESAFVFKPGIQHTVSLVISKNPEQVKIEIGGEIENWE